MANRLVNEKSPYLQQHKDNPVNWYPWCKEAFDKAQAEDKPVFLSIGYSTCHWCHVMAHESFEDKEIAALLDEYVCIKVDREERPDIDSVYMSVCQALTGSGGWPLTIFMTPKQKPFFAGTYFPKRSQYGHQGLADLLRQISKLWRENREMLLDTARKIILTLQREDSEESGECSRALLHQGYRLLLQAFDPDWGGFGKAPKFPSPHNLLFLMRMYESEKIPEALHMAETTLKAMADGGIFDHIGGGFSRYSTDQKWLVPHFEKMLYDNALLVLAYLEAFQLTKNPFYSHVAKRTADYMLRELAAPEGGFYCGQDADSDGVEGKYYVFTPDEIIQVLGKPDGMEFCRTYGITECGNFEGKNIPNQIGHDEREWDAEDPRLKRLYDFRKKRAHLHLDKKILLSWNTWAIIAMARAGLVLKDSRYTEAALKTQTFIREKMTDKKNRLFLRYCDGEAAGAGQLDDYAGYALALIELYRSTFGSDYLQEAVFRAKQMAGLFEDREKGGYYLTAHDSEPLIMRPKETYDGAIPSGNSVAQAVLQELADFTGETLFSAAANRQHKFMAGQADAYPSAHSFSLTAMAKALYPHKELVCTGAALPTELLSCLREHPAHNLNILFLSPENKKTLSEIAPFTISYPVSEHPVWYLCENGACHAPQRDFEKLDLALD
ncbi:MAG: thioredoxin domain-containing protein [Lachnospiraceae bacterium]|nr:thioredoxin domain-containing protein [Lachnospiraceae bacterium]